MAKQKKEAEQPQEQRAYLAGDKLWHHIPSPLGGRPRKFNSAAELWAKAQEYFQYVDDNPWQIKNASNSVNDNMAVKSNALRQDVQVRQRPYTLHGLCAFLGCSKWADIKRSYKDKAGFQEVFDAIENVITAQQLDGAMLRQFDSGIVARLNGLAETISMDARMSYDAPSLTQQDIAIFLEKQDGK